MDELARKEAAYLGDLKARRYRVQEERKHAIQMAAHHTESISHYQELQAEAERKAGEHSVRAEVLQSEEGKLDRSIVDTESKLCAMSPEWAAEEKRRKEERERPPEPDLEPPYESPYADLADDPWCGGVG